MCWMMFIGIFWAVPWTIVGIALIATIIGIPIGLLCFGIGAAPLTWLERRRIDQRLAWHDRDRTYAEEFNEEVPWEM